MEKFKINAYFDEQGEVVEKVITSFLVKNIDDIELKYQNATNIELMKY